MPATPLERLFTALAALFAAEGRPGGDAAAAALTACLPRAAAYEAPGHDPLPGLIRTALASHPHPAAGAVASAADGLHWEFAGLEDGRIRPEIARRMMTCELLGPTGMIPLPDLRVGLFAQSPGLDYVTRRHAAEETFIMLAGEGHWSVEGAPLAPRRAPAVIHHPSDAPHQSVTRELPLLAAWRWSGEIGWEGYRMIG